MFGLRGWHRFLGLSTVVLIAIYTTLLYGRPSWLPTPPPSWEATSGGLIRTRPKPVGAGGYGSTDSTSFTSSGKGGSGAFQIPPIGSTPTASNHPIDRLIEEARFQFKKMMGKRSLTLGQAALRYRERRQRHPPPGFDAWVAAAIRSDAVIIEDFFDRIYDDLAPFWTIEPATLRRQTHTQPQLIRIRNGTAWFETDNDKRPPWIQRWTEMVQEISANLPDLDMVLNVMDETRLLVPFDTVASYVKAEQEQRRDGRAMPRPSDTIATYSGLADVEAKKEPYTHSWITDDSHRFWDHFRASCPPDSPARNVEALSTFADPAEYPKTPNAAYTQQGFIVNATAARDPCLQPYLRSIHGTFIEGLSMSTSHDILPMFAGCKLPQNNEILIPGAMYLTSDPFYSGGKTHGVPWSQKKSAMVWRGTASGGRNKADTWWHFHRHRWVEMTNGTTVSAVEAGAGGSEHNDPSKSPADQIGPTFALPQEAAAIYGVQAQEQGWLGKWVAGFSDVGFVDHECYPMERDAKGKKVLGCDYSVDHFAVVPGKPMKEQYNYKFLPDVDGNSYSARWRGFLRSTSMPLKATIYAEWHDDRLIPWAHYVPFDISYIDLYGVMDYFLGGSGTPHGDAMAERIAEESRVWAESVLRREDMQLYVWRLLLEYARIVDDQRDRMAFVGDLVD